mmetsp:Transcript_74093/g.176487  ORF Transcript_74093/g.176487 Transcript_74093/m.176487 type:complete len:388 (+) Transcript_74093:125-1288(+)
MVKPEEITDFKDAAKHRVIATFRDWDENGDGSISLEELQDVLGQLGLSDDETKAIFETIDLNHDGSMNYAEFVSWLFGAAATQLPGGSEKKLWGSKALHECLQAAATGDVEKATSLIVQDHLLHVDSADADGTTLLMAAAKGGQLPLIKRLLEMKCSCLNALDQDGHTALDYAVALGHNHVVEYMKKGHVAHDNSATPFLRALGQAALRGDAKTVSDCLHPRVEFTVFIDRHLDTYHGLTTMPYKGIALQVKKIERGLIEDWNNKNPNLSVQVGDIIVQVNDVKGDAREVDRELQHYKELALILHRPRPDQAGNPDIRDEHGKTLLHHAAAQRKAKVVEALLDADHIQLNIKDHFDRTPLDVALELGEEDIARQLTKRGGKRGTAVN